MALQQMAFAPRFLNADLQASASTNSLPDYKADIYAMHIVTAKVDARQRQQEVVYAILRNAHLSEGIPTAMDFQAVETLQ